MHLLHKHAPTFEDIIFCTIYLDENGRRVWDEEDAKKHNDALKKYMLLGVNHYGIRVWFRKSRTNSFLIRYDWKHCGTFTMPIDGLQKESFDNLSDAIFVQMMLTLKNGEDIWLGDEKILNRHTEYQELLTADLL